MERAASRLGTGTIIVAILILAWEVIVHVLEIWASAFPAPSRVLLEIWRNAALLPTGITRAKNGDGEEAEVTLQPGSGSTDGIIGMSFRQVLLSVPTVTGEYSALPLVLGMTYQINGAGTDGWRFGNSLVASLGTAYQFTHRMSLLLQFNGKFQGFADIGETGEPRENTGGTWIFASPGVSVELSDGFSAYGYVQIPVDQNVHGIQQAARFNLQFGISASVDLLE